MSLRFREKIQALLWWSDNSLRVELGIVLIQPSLRIALVLRPHEKRL